MTGPVAYPRHPAHLDAFVDVLGPELAVRFLLRFGGRTIYFPDDTGGRGAAEQMIGRAHLIALGRRMRASRVEIPIART